MQITQPAQNDEQNSIWNGPSGHAWAETHQIIEQLLKPFEDVLIRSIAASSVHRPLDVGCGTGSTTVALAHQLGATGSCTGIDISEPMLAVARSRPIAAPASARFVLGDAQTYPFEPASFDAIVSRFGVMFFSDSVLAFSNLRNAVAPKAPLCFVAWRSMAENEFMTTAERVAAPLIPDLPVRSPNEPGQFAFADRERVHHILLASGWSGIDIHPIDIPCTIPEKDLPRYITRFGPVGRVLEQTNEHTREQVVAEVRAALQRYVHGSQVQFTSACWLVRASA